MTAAEFNLIIYRKTSVTFSLELRLGDTTPNITADTVTLRLFDQRTRALVLQYNADVTTNGASGVALFTLTPAQTNLPAGAYYVDIVWYRSDGKIYLPVRDIIAIQDRQSAAVEV
jgi:hypothetical protein